jgi:hypothetical protein
MNADTANLDVVELAGQCLDPRRVAALNEPYCDHRWAVRGAFDPRYRGTLGSQQ